VQDHLPREAKAEWLSSFGKSSGAGFTKSEGSVGLGSNGRAAAQHVSEYAGKNHRELFAESFSLYTHKDYASGKVRQLPSSVHAFMDKHVGRKKS